MSSHEKLLEHLEPVVFTAVVCLIGYLLDKYYRSRIEDFISPVIQASPLPRIWQLIESQIASVTLYLDQWLESIDYWGHAQQREMASFFMYTPEIVPDVDSLEIPIKPLRSFTHPSTSQHDSPLLNLPTEIIDVIATYVLTPHQDLERPYDFFTCYRRPGNLAPTKISTTLLQTCQFFYSTYWYLPWTLSTHNFYLTSSDRRPERTTTIDQMTRTSHLIAHVNADAPARRKEVSHVQIFPQLYALENGSALSQILSIPHFRPQVVTITIRHTDWWYWESDKPLSFGNIAFVGTTSFPLSTTTVHIELESLERRKPQVDWMADHISQNWHFRRVDDGHLVADPAVIDSDTWKGAATWGGHRWVRDENDAEPNVLRYYVRTVTFRSVPRAEDVDGYEGRGDRKFQGRLEVDGAVAAKTRIVGGVTSLPVRELQAVGIRDREGEGEEGVDLVKASEAVKRVHESRAAARLAREETGWLAEGDSSDEEAW